MSQAHKSGPLPYCRLQDNIPGSRCGRPASGAPLDPLRGYSIPPKLKLMLSISQGKMGRRCDYLGYPSSKLLEFQLLICWRQQI